MKIPCAWPAKTVLPSLTGAPAGRKDKDKLAWKLWWRAGIQSIWRHRRQSGKHPKKSKKATAFMTG
jgi:hypothetical protein